MATILVVDDRALNREFLSTLLAYGMHRVVEAADGAEALAKARLETPDLVISDILMPTMDGIQFVQTLRQAPATAEIPVIFYTATYRMPEARNLAQECGVTVVIPKPSVPEVILEAVHSALNLPSSQLRPEAIPASQMRGVDLIVDRLTVYLEHLEHVNLELSAMVERGLELTSERDQLRKLSEGLSNGWTSIQNMSLRLATLTELGTDLALERDPQKLLEMVCAAAQDISVARYAGLGMLDDSGTALRHFIGRGFDPETMVSLGCPPPRTGIFCELFETDAAVRRSGLDGDPERVGLPVCHPPVHSFLAVPLRTQAQTLGWLYVVNKLGAQGFSEDDERVVATLATQAAAAYESVRLYDELQRHSGELMRTQGVLREREERLRQVTENIHEVFWMAKADLSEILYVSPAYEEIWGRSCESLYASPLSWFEAIHPDDLERVRAAAVDSALGGMNQTFRVMRPDGSARWIHSRGTAILDSDGVPYRVTGIAEDITVRKRAELRLEGQYAVTRLLAESKSLAEAAPGLIQAIARSISCVVGELWEMDEEQQVLRAVETWSDPAVDVSELMALTQTTYRAGVGPGRVLASGSVIWVPDVADEQSARATAAAKAGLQGAVGVPIILRGQVLGVMVFFSRDVRPPETDTIGMLADIGKQIGQFMERCRAQEEVLQHAEELARSNTELGRFAQVAAHDLREPLRTISSHVQLLARRCRGRLDADADQFIDFAVGGTRRMARLLDDLLTYSTVEHSQQAFEPVDCRALMAGALGHLGPEIAESGAEVICNPLPVVSGSRHQLEMLFEQLIDNAIKFRGALPPRIEIQAEQNGREWIFSVRDNGIGIDPQYAERIFVIFQRLHPPDRFPGTGAGLAVARKIVERHGGRIWVESQPGQGASFRFTLRDAGASETREPAAAA